MDQKRNADVVVPIVDADLAIVGRARRLLDASGPSLQRLILVDAGRLTGAFEVALAELALDPRVRRVHGEGQAGWCELCNLGLAARTGDAVIVTTEFECSDGWLNELVEAAHSGERVALAAPVEIAVDRRRRREAALRRAVAGLPRWSSHPRSAADCNYLRDEALAAVGLPDPTFSTPSAAIDDWLERAAAVGFFARRANRAFIFSAPDSELPSAVASARTADRSTLDARRPRVAARNALFDRTLEASLARHAVDFTVSGKLAVALDLRHLPMEQNGTRTYAVNLGKALSAVPEIDLTLIAAHPIQADGVPGRVVHPDAWADDVAVIHKPAQVFDRRHAELLFSSRAHVFITYQDLIAYRTPGVFPSEEDYDAYRITSRLTVQAAQGVLAYSQCTASEIADEFALPIDEVSPLVLGVDGEAFAAPVADLESITARLGLPVRYFLCLAGDYPHKNTLGLLEGYAEFRRNWKDGEPPALVLAGNAPVVTTSAWGRTGVHCLGVVSADELRALYQGAEAFVFPSLYEGFGLPPFEAMAAGAPVVAMPFSSVPEVCGDAAVYSEGLRPVDLARVLTRVASDPGLRADLAARGRRRIETLRWEATARATYNAYRRAVLRPSLRSLQMRRLLNEAVVLWSRPPEAVLIAGAPATPPEPEPTPAPPVVSEPDEPIEEPAAEVVLVAESPIVEIPEPDETVEAPAEEAVQTADAPTLEAFASGDESSLVVDEPAAEEAVGLLLEAPGSMSTSTTDEGNLAPAPVEAASWIVPAPMEPMGIRNACCALREALGRRVRRDVGHFKDAQRLRGLRASRLSRRFVEVVRSDGLSAALVRTTRKLGGKLSGRSTSSLGA